MAGLLYKDFVAIRGKIYAICMVAVLVLGFVLRLIVKDEATEYILVMYVPLMVFSLYLLVNNKMETDLMQVDEAKKQKQYCLSLPINKKLYVAEKYVFMLLIFYIAQSFVALFCSIMAVDCVTTICMQILSSIMAIIPIITTGMMTLAAIELPFFIGAGYKRGKILKQGILEGFFVVFIVYLLFGDLTVFEKFSLEIFVTWLEEHQDVVNALHVFTPVIGLAIFYISYRISCFLYERRELSDD